MSTTPQRQFGLGCIHDSPHRIKMYRPALGPAGSRALLKGSVTLTTGLKSLAEFEVPIFDQGPTGSCEGHRGAMGVSVAFNALGTPLAFIPSPDGFYRDLRCQARVPNANGTFPPLTDSGGMTSDFVTIAKTCGARKMGPPPPDGRNSDVDPSTVNDEPTLDQLDTEAEAPVLIDPGAYAIDLTDTVQALAVIQQCLALKMPVALDIICDQAMQDWFANWKPGAPPLDTCNPNDPTAGGHAVLNDELQVNTTSDGLLGIANSWSKDYGAPSLAQGPNAGGHLIATFNWFKLAVVNAVVLKCSRVPA